MKYKLLWLVFILLSSCSSKTKFPKEFDESFSIEITWGMVGDCYYNSSTGFLTKAKHSSEEKYNTTYFLSDKEKERIFYEIKDLNIDKYPSKYEVNPKWIGISVTPCESLGLSVETNSYKKSVYVEDYVVEFGYEDKRAMNFVNTIKYIKNILTTTDSWRNLPELDFAYM